MHGQDTAAGPAVGYGSPASARGTIAVNPAITKPNSAITPMMWHQPALAAFNIPTPTMNSTTASRGAVGVTRSGKPPVACASAVRAPRNVIVNSSASDGNSNTPPATTATTTVTN